MIRRHKRNCCLSFRLTNCPFWNGSSTINICAFKVDMYWLNCHVLRNTHSGFIYIEAIYNPVPIISKLKCIGNANTKTFPKKWKQTKTNIFFVQTAALDNFEESVILNSDSTNWLFRDHKSQHLLEHRTRFSIRSKICIFCEEKSTLEGHVWFGNKQPLQGDIYLI